VLALADAIGAEARRQQQVAAEHHERHDADHRIATDGATVAGAELRAVLRRVRHAHRRAVHAEDGEPAPAMPVCARLGPHLRALLEEPAQRRCSQPRPCLHHRAGGDAPGARTGENQRQLPHDLHDRQVPEERHPEHEPDDLLGRKAPAPQRRRPRGGERLQHPTRIDRGLESSERASIGLADGNAEAHAIALRGDRRIMISPIEAARLRPASPKRRGGAIGWLLTDRHWH